MKIIYLDIDGVLNSTAYLNSTEYLYEVRNLKPYRVIWEAHHTHLDPKAIKLMNALVEETDAYVVASTAWRNRYSVCALNRIFRRRGATFAIVDSTPVFYPKRGELMSVRGDEIEYHLCGLFPKPESYVIIDDRGDMANVMDHLVQTDIRCGVTAYDIKRASNILNGVSMLSKHETSKGWR